MKKFLFLTTAVFLLLAVSMAFYTPLAKADAPADFVVGIKKKKNPADSQVLYYTFVIYS